MLRLYVDGDRWRAHLRSVVDDDPRVVPVAKGNGYGLGLARLARKTAWLGLDTIAVGTYGEVPEVSTRFDGSVLVLTPWRPFEARADLADRRVVHTVGRVEDLQALLERAERPRLVLERMTSMRRHGLTADGLREAGRLLRSGAGRKARLEGVALHLPMAHGSHLGEVQRLLTDVVAADLDTRTAYVSHLRPAEMAALRSSWSDYDLRPRTGTGLWLGDRGALEVRSTVLDVHEVQRGDVYGYRGRTAPRAGAIVVVSGGTAHGIGLEAPHGVASLKERASVVAKGGLDAAGFVRSPFTVTGKQRLFAEPPHMQASMLFLPAGSELPAVGDEVPVRVRFTTTTVDETVLT